MTMPMADNRHSRVIRRRQLQPSPVARPRQRRIEFFLDHRLDEAAHLRSQTCLDRIEPIVEKFFFGRVVLSTLFGDLAEGAGIRENLR